MQYSLEVAKIKLNYKKEILDIERRNKMVGGRVEKVYIYREDEEFVDKIKKIFKYIHDESCIMQLVHFLSK
jgi:chorismate mutase